MSTLKPRLPYDEQELARLYPANLQLEKVQVLLRHGERTPVSSRFQNAGLPSSWPYCQAASHLRSAVRSADGSWDTLTWTRRLEGFGTHDKPRLAAGPNGEIDNICQAGELTDKGRATTLAFGQRLRFLYVQQLGFLPAQLDARTRSTVSLRATPVPRALESVQQAFTGLYPAATRAPDMSPPAIVQRAHEDEILFPNEWSCKRFAELSHGFADRAAQVWNDSPEMKYINKQLGKWMPKDSPEIKVDSHPRLSGIMDTINATLAHGSATRLPAEFYDEQVRSHIDRVCTAEWFAGYQESDEYRKLGIGALIGDLTQRMVEHTRGIAKEGESSPSKISLAGCHDTTLAATLTSLGAFQVDQDRWPPFTSSVAFELFKSTTDRPHASSDKSSSAPASWPSRGRSWWFHLFSSPQSLPDSREPSNAVSDSVRAQLDGHYVRIRYNDTPVTLPFCRAAGRHLEGDETFCTLAAFKQAADMVTPTDWRAECKSNLGAPVFSQKPSPPPGVSS